MKQKLHCYIESVSVFIEIMISVLIIIGISIMAAQLVKDIVLIVSSLVDSTAAIPFETFMGDALKLIIAIEFVKMLIRHTPESVVEVLLFAIARKLIVGNYHYLDIVIGIGAITVLFVVRRFLFQKNE